ncbi:MAG: FAD-binding protein [Myxococcales bacterium]|nr:FAD-binding protein [Myxococcales bacterium]
MRSIDLQLPIADAAPPGESDPAVLHAAAQALGLPFDAIAAVRVRRRSLDVRRRREPAWVLRCDVFTAGEPLPGDHLPTLLQPLHLAKSIGNLRPIVVGMGPAGLFAALTFADAGVRCILLDRGEPVEPRSLHVRDLRIHRQLHAESNLCYGEGGAGTFSDGKLYTRSKHPLVRPVYERLVALGADRDILVHAHPHVGSNRLIPMMKRLREALLEAGHDLRFGARVDDLVIEDGANPRVVGVQLATGETLVGGPVLLATGHSARDTYRMLARRGIAMQRKDFAIGGRVEHPQELVDSVQLGPLAGHAAVGAAEYFLAQTVPGSSVAGGATSTRGVYSFCMCPGGFVLPSPTALLHLNVNGMSNAGRNSPFANAALVAQLAATEFYLETPGDLDDDPDFGAHMAGGALLGVALQARLEQAAYTAGGGGYMAPAQRLTDFVAGRESVDLPDKYSYRPGVAPARVDRLLPRRIVLALQGGARQVERSQLRGYLTAEAMIVGVETTTSSPVRVLRGADRQSVSHAGLYPCAEGAGYAGGIVSSAIEGMESARAILAGAPSR